MGLKLASAALMPVALPPEQVPCTCTQTIKHPFTVVPPNSPASSGIQFARLPFVFFCPLELYGTIYRL